MSGKMISSIIDVAIDLGFRAFDVDRNQAKEALKVPYFKKGLLNVLNGIGRYGVTKPYRTPASFLVVWNYTNACNLRCKHCYQRADKPTPDELTTEEGLAIVDQLDENNVSALAFSGGEPLMRRDLFEVAEYAHDRRLKLDYAQFSVATPYPGTELYDIARRDGLLLTKDWSHFTAARPVRATRNLSPREIQKLFKEAYIKYYLSPRILLRNMNRYTLPLSKIVARSSLNFKPKTSQGETYP
ncbi:MAG: radical SAM protein [Nitrososphaerota archaeon]